MEDSSSVSPNSSEDQNSDGSSPACSKIRIRCSYGGRILPRQHDGQLRYVGGETRILLWNRSITLAEMMGKLGELVGRDGVVVKYQLPDEDLDALISVVTDEDFSNMLDEYEKLKQRRTDTTGCVRLRLFLFFPVKPEEQGYPGRANVRQMSAPVYSPIADQSTMVNEDLDRLHCPSCQSTVRCQVSDGYISYYRVPRSGCKWMPSRFQRRIDNNCLPRLVQMQPHVCELYHRHRLIAE